MERCSLIHSETIPWEKSLDIPFINAYESPFLRTDIAGCSSLHYTGLKRLFSLETKSTKQILPIFCRFSNYPKLASQAMILKSTWLTTVHCTGVQLGSEQRARGEVGIHQEQLRGRLSHPGRPLDCLRRGHQQVAGGPHTEALLCLARPREGGMAGFTKGS